MQPTYGFEENGGFVIRHYDKAKPFASFLPGIAGLSGIPMWSFYVNRGQGMGSFGVRDKEGVIMEFIPASLMYRNIAAQGFRTFIRVNGVIHEPFSPCSADDCTRTMRIEMNALHVEEQNRTLGLCFTATYYTMPGEDYAGMVRRLSIQSLDGGEHTVELLDGLPQLLPYGMGNSAYREMANLARSWFEVYNTENRAAFYKVRATMSDTVEVSEVERGNFYLAFSTRSGGLLPPLYDMDVIFGPNTALTGPDGWDCPVEELLMREQVSVNKASGGFAGERVTVGAEPYALYSVIGHIAGVERLNQKRAGFTPAYMEQKLGEARALTDGMVKATSTQTAHPLFDRYIDQCYLDNLLRGGLPLILRGGDKRHVYHVYSRKHGDLEREYNFFSLEPSYYSQGNGNFRDVNQNRRSDIFFNPEIGDFNVRHFMNLIQADGYNPLLVKGCTFSFDMEALKEVLPRLKDHREELGRFLAAPFTPGTLLSFVADHGVTLTGTPEDLLEAVLTHAEQNYEADFGEGYWSDHWTYNLDHIEAYLAVYPDKKEELLYGGGYRFFQSPEAILPRARRVVRKNGKVRQYHFLVNNEAPAQGGSWLRTSGGKVYETSLFAKVVCLILTKFTNLDPLGLGVEMEGGRPGWNDALNGLPALFGSGVGETAELVRLTRFALACAQEFKREVVLPCEAAELLEQAGTLTEQSLSGALTDFAYWDAVGGEKERYRERVRGGFSGEERTWGTDALAKTLALFEQKLVKGLQRAKELGGGLVPTYFAFEAKAYEPLEGDYVRVTEFSCRALPAFLEAPARLLKTLTDAKEAKELYDRVRASEIYDKSLGMYKTSAPLEGESPEIGRLRAFTPGWLERESVFLHMEYKYLLSLLTSGLYEEFYSDIQTALIPFLKPEVYGRSTLENSSFLASSANPDAMVHGRGFVSRLSGSTAEALSMWMLMMCGKSLFSSENGLLRLNLAPILPGWLFDERGELSFTLLGNITVRCHNPRRRATFGENGAKPQRIRLTYKNGECVEGQSIAGKPALDVREGRVAAIDLYLS